MSTFVKICGLKDRHDVQSALKAGADAVGLVCAPTSPRFVPPERACELAAYALSLGGTPVFVTMGRADIFHALHDGIATGAWVQLHGGEDAAETRWVADYTRAPVIKALSVSEPADLACASDFGAADRILLDAKPPKGADRTGGHGRTFDWSLLAGWRSPKPWLLSGGLTPENVADAIRATGASAVDVSSGVERAPGEKDLSKIKAFVDAAKAARPSGAAA
jgi:phosphoribosylanthranilate isomerase